MGAELMVPKPSADEMPPAPVIRLGDASEPGVLDPPGELIEPGRALVLGEFAPPKLAPGERLLRLAYSLGLARLRPGRGRKPIALTATAHDPLPGSRIAGTALRAGHFLVHGAKAPIAQIDFHGVARLAPALERVVHSFAWAADLEAAGPREAVAPVAERLHMAWLEANLQPPSRPGKGAGWSLAHTGARVLSCLLHAPLLYGSSDPAQRARALAALGADADWLDRHIGRAEDKLAAVAGWCGITAAGLLLPDGNGRRLYGEAGLVRALGEVVGDDGGVLARSPLAQIETIALLAQLKACYQAAGAEIPPAIAAVLALLVPPLLALAHSDGSLGSWQGGWAIPSAEVEALVAASGVRTRPLRDVRHWGYQRVVAGKAVLLFDAAPPPLPRHARAGCASTLAFELSAGGQRIVVNCGGGAIAGGLIPARLETALRASAAHSTLVLDDANSTAVLINGKIGAGVTEVEVDRRTILPENAGLRGLSATGATRLEASHNGYAARFGLIHRRILIMRDDGSELRGEDLLLPTGRKGKSGKIGFAIRFHLGAGIEAVLSEDGQGAGLMLPDGSHWQFRSGGGQVAVEDSLWVDGEGRPQPVQQLVLQGMVSRGGGNFAWLLKKMG